MSFNSIQFALFFPIAFLLYWFVFDKLIGKSKHQLRLQNAFVVLASYVFYGWWNKQFLLLIFFTSLSSWLSGLFIENAKSRKASKVWVAINIFVNIGILAFFKYYNFFVTEFCQAFHILSNKALLKVILPAGISFYTFQAVSYSVDVYRKKVEATRDILAFFAFISFFPQLVAGPIERATNLLPQFQRKRMFNPQLATDGMRQFLWGLFKKTVIADNCALHVASVFYWSSRMVIPGSDLLLGAVLFSFQIYADFSGYSDLAIGTSKLFGIKLMQNFRFPYFSRDLAEFWRRWHISLNTWFRDYVYIPLGGSRAKKAVVVRNIFIVFILSAIWHGAGLTYLLWGVYHALLFIPLVLLGKNRNNLDVVASKRLLPNLKELGQIMVTFMFVTFGWIVFRSDNLHVFFHYVAGMAQWGTLQAVYRFFIQSDMWPMNLFICLMLIVEWLQRDKAFGLDIGFIKYRWARWAIYLIVCVMIIMFGGLPAPFVYFQF
jgi:D-alanyl-lipoteichoic acid acyltransferase DltB (MBOAT superfamily)